MGETIKRKENACTSKYGWYQQVYEASMEQLSLIVLFAAVTLENLWMRD